MTSLRAEPPISFGPDTSGKLTHNTNIKEIGLKFCLERPVD